MSYKERLTILHTAEYNRMIKAMYLLDYIDDASLRRYVQRAVRGPADFPS